MLLGLEVENFQRAYRWEREGWVEGGGIVGNPNLVDAFFSDLNFSFLFVLRYLFGNSVYSCSWTACPPSDI